MPIPRPASARDDLGPDRHLLRDDAFMRLRDAIVDGVLEPGEQLRDLELATWLGISRTPVREALLRLGEMGLVVTRPGRSTVVSELDHRTLQDARDVVAGMHAVAVAQAVGSLTGADIREMKAANRRFRAAIKVRDIEAALRADDELHAVPVRVAGNHALEAVLAQHGPILRRAEKALFSTMSGRESVALHASMIALCEAGDARGAALVSFDTWSSLALGPGAPDTPSH